MIQIKNVSKSYDGKKKAVDSLSLDINDGEIFGLLGPNGAGKSTLLKMMVGILAPDEGEIRLNGHSIQTDTLAAKQRFGYVSDNPDHLLRLKGHEFLRFMADAYHVPDELRADRIAELAEEFSLSDELNNQIQSFSHGMRQKMMVMGALISDPEIWILDEPMTGLDPRAAFLLKQRMRRHADSGKIVLFSTHVLDVAEKVVDRVGVINKGELVFVGTVEELRAHFDSNSSLEEMFLELTEETADFADESQA
ncbi:MAG: ABC transporter ATP-binding protein [Eubacteriales bacterium]|nr:ABC transporter ATP-binding protein [Eubacteriales bacterium]